MRGITSPMQLSRQPLIWMPGDAYVVGTWTNGGTLVGNNAVQATAAKKPSIGAGTLNGRPYVHFDGAAFQGLVIPNISYGNFHKFVVMRGTVPGMVLDHYLDANNLEYLYAVNAATINVTRASVSSVKGVVNIVTSWGSDNGWRIIEHVFDGTNAGHKFLINGQLAPIGSNSSVSNPGIAAINAPLAIGFRATDTMHHTGDIAEILCFDAVLPDGDAVNLRRYLHRKYFDGRQNRFPNSQRFDLWSKSGVDVTVTANAVLAPDDTMTADRVQMTAGAPTSRYLFNSYDTFPGQWCVSVWARVAAGTAKIRFRTASVPGGAVWSEDFTITDAWQRIVLPYVSNYILYGTTSLLIGSDSAGSELDCFMWGAQIVNSNWVGDYLATEAAPMSMGIRSKIGESQNLIPRSRSLATGGWSTEGVGTTLVNSDAVPDQEGVAPGVSRVTWGAGTLPSMYGYATGVAGLRGLCTISAWARSVTGTSKVRIRQNSVVGSPTISSDFTLTTAWQQISLQVTAGQGGLGATTLYYASDGSAADFYVTDVQLVYANHAGKKTTTAGTAITQGIRSQVKESQNLLVSSGDIGNAAWSKYNSSVPVDTIIAPDGTNTAKKIVEQATTAGHSVYQARTDLPAGMYTYSTYVKAAERTAFALEMWNNAPAVDHLASFDLTTQTIAYWNNTGFAYGIYDARVDYPNAPAGWWRVWITGPNKSSTLYVYSLVQAIAGSQTAYAGDIAKGIYVWGEQLNYANFAAPYTATVETAITNGIRSKANIRSLCNQ